LYEAFRVATKDKDCARDAAVKTSRIGNPYKMHMFAPNSLHTPLLVFVFISVDTDASNLVKTSSDFTYIKKFGSDFATQNV
jgi:hypothetical protein